MENFFFRIFRSTGENERGLNSGSMLWNTRNELRDLQQVAIQRLFEEVIGRNAFYTRKLEAAGVFGSAIDLEEFAEKIPFTSRREWTQDRRSSAVCTNLTYPVRQYTRYCQTSGSTGKPMKWLDTNASWAWMLDNWKRVYKAAGIEPGKMFCVFDLFSGFGPHMRRPRVTVVWRCPEVA